MTNQPTENHPFPEVELALAEGRKLLARLPEDAVRAPFVEAGALAWGMLRAIMECPNCPGKFRVPVRLEQGRWVIDNAPGSNWDHIACANCQNIWHRAGDNE